MQRLIQPLLSLYDRDEACALLRMLVEDLCHESWTRFIAYGCQSGDVLLAAIDRLATGEPIQHILGFTSFCGHHFHVTPDTLIPRPETEDLVRWIVADALDGRIFTDSEAKRVLDIGTGTGCIAISLALGIHAVDVTALDVSASALDVARGNWQALCPDGGCRSSVAFLQHDILASAPSVQPVDVIVSNPPYICDKEKVDMHVNVLDHDPHLALFVPDDDPLLFYRAIANHGLSLLKPDGVIYFELNSLYAEQTAVMLRDMGYADVELRPDRFARMRMLKATRNRRQALV